MAKRIVVALLLFFIYMMFILMISTIYPNSEIRFLFIGICGAAYILGAYRLHKKLFLGNREV